MNSINIGNISNATFKVGSDDCSIYLGETKLYPICSAPSEAQWHTYTSSDTQPYNEQVYGVRIDLGNFEPPTHYDAELVFEDINDPYHFIVITYYILDDEWVTSEIKGDTTVKRPSNIVADEKLVEMFSDIGNCNSWKYVEDWIAVDIEIPSEFEMLM